MRAAFVAARDKVRVRGVDFFQRRNNVPALYFCRISRWPDQHKIVVHHGKALDCEAFGDDFFFRHLVVHKQHVGIAAAAHVYGLAGADRDHFDVDARGIFKRWQQVRKQPRLLGGGCRRHHDRIRLCYTKSSCKRTSRKGQRPKKSKF